MASVNTKTNLNEVQALIAQALQQMIDDNKRELAEYGCCCDEFEDHVTIGDKSYALTGKVSYRCSDRYDYTSLPEPLGYLEWRTIVVDEYDIEELNIVAYDDIEEVEIPCDIDPIEILQSLKY